MSTPRVGLLEGRMGSELASLVLRHGGEPVVAPALSEAPVDAGDAVGALIDALGRGEVQVVVFLTGVGATRLFAEAERIGRLPELLEGLGATTNVSRGQKPWQPLRRAGVPVSVTVPDPYTTDDVIETLSRLDLAGKGVALLHYGERSEAIAAALAAMGADSREIFVYEWRLPDDVRPLESLIDQLLAGRLDAIAFTSQVQVRHLFQVAEPRCGAAALREALETRTLVSAVGPTCAAALAAAGVTPRVVPANPKMGPMVVALMEALRGTAERATA